MVNEVIKTMKILIYILFFILTSLFAKGQLKYAERLNANGTTDSFYVKIKGSIPSLDSVFNFSNDAFVSFTKEYYETRYFTVYPGAFGNYIKGADNVYRNSTQRAESVNWDVINNKPTSILNISGTNSGDNAVNSTYESDYRLSNFIAGTNYLAPNGNGSLLTGITKTQVGLANVDNTSDANKPVSSATQTALNLKANLSSPTFTGTVSGITATMVGLGNVTNESKATMFTSPTFTGTTSGITKSMVGLGNVDNTSDAAKPISTATQTALDGKQATLVSATNIKTVNGNTLLGSGDIVVGGGATSSTSGVAATATASGTQTITHNLGRTPTIIRIYSISSFTSNAAATPVPFSNGIWNSSGNRCVYMVINGTTTQVSQTSTVFSIIMVTSAGNNITGVIGNVTPTSFDIVWTETGTHTAGNYLWEAQ